MLIGLKNLTHLPPITDSNVLTRSTISLPRFRLASHKVAWEVKYFLH